MGKEAKQFLVLGLGRFGASVAENLCRLGHEVLAVDADEEPVQEIAPLVTQAVQADATDEAALDALGAGSFDAAIVSIGTNVRDSILVSVLCKERGIPLVAAKAVDALHARVLRKVGVDRVIFPEREMGQRFARSLSAPHIMDLVELSGEDEIAEMQAPQAWCGRTLMDISVRSRYGVSVIGIRREGRLIASPGAQERLLAGDVLVVMGKTKDIDDIH